MEKEEYRVVTPLAEKDIQSYIDSLPMKKRFLHASKFVVIGNDIVCNKISKNKIYDIECINENRFVSYKRIEEIIGIISNNNKECLKRSGWYLQQFLKFFYSFLCEDEYYLLWDADTVPIHEHIMFVDRQMVFDMKTEHHQPYYDTYSKLFPKHLKRNTLSYISEHMIIKTSIMKSLIEEISKLDIYGNTWYEKILYSIDINELPHSGFSDYETYGLYCLNLFPTLYKERIWSSLRPASKYFVLNEMRKCDYEWLLQDYDAISFESSRKINKLVNCICRNRSIQKKITCKKLLLLLRQFTI